MIILISIHDDAAVPIRTPYPSLFVGIDDDGRPVGTLSTVSDEVGEELLVLDVESPLSFGFKVSGFAVVALGNKLGSTTTTGANVVGVFAVSTGDPVAGITGDVVVAVMDGTGDGTNGDCDGDTSVVGNSGAVKGGLVVGTVGDMVPQLEAHPNTSAMQSPSNFPVRSQVGQQLTMAHTESMLLQDFRTSLSAVELVSVQVVEQRPPLDASLYALSRQSR